MTGKAPKKDDVLFLCSPNLGILDNWLPVIWKLKEKGKGLKFTFALTTPQHVDKINLESVLFILAQKVFDRVIFRSRSGAWLSADSFPQAKKLNEKRPFFLEKLIFILINGLEKHRTTRFLGSFIEKAYQKMMPFGMARQMIDWPDLVERTCCLLYDLNKEKKANNLKLTLKLKEVTKFSLLHGVNFRIEAKHYKVSSFGTKNVTAYLYSDIDQDYYKEIMEVPESNIRVVGVPRHSPDWINTLIANIPGEKEVGYDDYIFVISRAANKSYFPFDRKRQALIDLRTLAWNDLDKKLVVKLHPNERKEGLYEEVFGSGNYGEKWVYSDLHPLILGRKCLFAVCFYSGVAIDMVAMGVPTIERFDVRGIPEYDNKNSLRDENGNPVRVLRFMNLVLGSDNYEQMKKHAMDIMNHREEVIKRLTSTYDNLLPRQKNVNDQMADDILSAIGKW